MHPIFLLLFFYLKSREIYSAKSAGCHTTPVHLSDAEAACCVDTKGKPNRLLQLSSCTLSSPLENKNSVFFLRKCGQTSDMKVVIFIKSTCRAQPERGKSHVVFTVSMFARQLQTWISNYCHIVELNLHTKTCF